MVSVLHINNPAGVATHLSEALNEMGIQSKVLIQNNDPFNYGYDYQLDSNLSSDNRPIISKGVGHLANLTKTLRMSHSYDIIHFHSSSILDFDKRFFPRGIDVPIFKATGPAVVVHHHGSNLRGSQEPFFHRKFADEILVSTPDLLIWNPKSRWIPNPVDVESIPYVGVPEPKPPFNIVHAPSDRETKGTKFVIDAVNELKNQDYSVELDIVENASRQEVLNRFQSADIVVDQLNLGWYGVVSVEGMAMGKPVCVYINDEYKPEGFETPLVETTPDSLVNNLAELLDNYTKRKRIGTRGRKFTEEIHKLDVVAKNMEGIYEGLL